MSKVKLVSVKDLCEALHVHRSTIYEWRKEGKLPEPVKRWGAPRYDWEQVQEALAEGKKKS